VIIFDRDFYEPDNAVRHEGSVMQFGLFKVEVVGGRIFELNPGTFERVDLSLFQIGGPVNLEEQKKLFDHIASADLVVDATGVHGVSRFINSLCQELGVPSIYASVTNGAWGGEVVRVVPGKTACWMCWYKQYESEHPSSAPAPAVGVFAPGCNQPTFTGTTYETGMVANLAAWMAIETLLLDNPERKDFRGDYLRWTGRDKEGVPAPVTEVLLTRVAEDCLLCQMH
jgi:molybdopterin/thiamine biosynthesis adenylyltransferase